MCTIPQTLELIHTYIISSSFPKIPSVPNSAPKARRWLDRQESVPFPGTQLTDCICSARVLYLLMQSSSATASRGLLPEMQRTED